MKNAEAAISSRSREVKRLRTGEGATNLFFFLGGVLLLGGVSVPHYMPWLFEISHNCVTECTLQAKFLLKRI